MTSIRSDRRFTGSADVPSGGHSQESGGDKSLNVVPGQRVLVRVVDQFVAGDLFPEKAIKRFVGIEGPNHVVAIPPGPGADHVGVTLAFRVSVSGQIQPEPCPVLSVTRGVQQPIDERFPGIRPVVVEPGVDLFRFGRKGR